MSLEKAHMPLTVKQIAIMDKAEKFDFNHIVQRGLVWEHSRKSALIESLIFLYLHYIVVEIVMSLLLIKKEHLIM